MLINYLKVAWKILLRQKFYTFISLFGISLTLLTLLVATAILDHAYGPLPPEVHADRTLGVKVLVMKGPDDIIFPGGPGYFFLNRWVRPMVEMPEVERVAVFSLNETAVSFTGGRRIVSSLKRTDGEVPTIRPPGNLLVKIRPGTAAAFEKELMARLQRAAPGWSFQVTPLTELRKANIRGSLAPLVLGGVLAFFLLAMVALGLVGVLWQNLLRRTREFGLRRAAGASGSQVRRQIVMEQLFLSGLGLLLGTVLLLHLPVFDLLGFVSLEVFMAALLTALAAMLLLTLACALCPSWLTSRVPPAEALRYE